AAKQRTLLPFALNGGRLDHGWPVVGRGRARCTFLVLPGRHFFLGRLAEAEPAAEPAAVLRRCGAAAGFLRRRSPGCGQPHEQGAPPSPQLDCAHGVLPDRSGGEATPRSAPPAGSWSYY